MRLTQLALVTGAADGIGFEFCKVLASKGYDLILVSRREDKLQNAANELSGKYHVVCHVIPCDLAEPKAAEKLFQTTKDRGLEVNFLVNNAGLLFNGPFTKLDLEAQESLLNVNMVALTSLTHLFANYMVSRDGGHILNVASTAAWFSIPNQNIYAASKAYVLSFTQALSNEMKASETNVNVTALCPSYTDTKMLFNPEQGAKLSIPKFMILSADFVAKQGINSCLKGKSICIPGLANLISMQLVQMIPKTWITKVMGKAYRAGMTE